MKALEKIAGVAAFVQAIGFILVLAYLLVLLPGLGVGSRDAGNAAKLLAASTSPLARAYYPIFVSFGVTLVLVTLGVNEHL